MTKNLIALCLLTAGMAFQSCDGTNGSNALAQQDDKTKVTSATSPMAAPPPCTLRCPESATPSRLRTDGDFRTDTAAWRQLVRNSPMRDVHSIYSFYVSKEDLLRSMCLHCNEATGVLITFGYEPGDGTAAKPRKLIPYVSSANLNQIEFDVLSRYGYVNEGCPGGPWCDHISGPPQQGSGNK